MKIDKSILSRMLLCAADLMWEQCGILSEIDSKFGDGDHGITVGKIAQTIQTAVESWEDESIQSFLDDLGMAVMGVNGGSAGPLYGTMIGGLSEPLGEESEINGVLFQKMLSGSLSAMEEITTAKVGDKTMMDALIPAVEAAQNVEADVEAVAAAAARAAKDGAKASEQFISKFGRAKSYKEQTIGTPDAGAVSTSLFFEGLAKGCLND